MLTLMLYSIAVAATVSGQHDCTGVTCDERLIHFYTEHLCVPVQNEGDCCPTSFNCESVETRNPAQCHLKGHAYEIGSKLTAEQVGQKCLAECSCTADPEDSTKAHLQCARIECPEHLGVPAPTGCIYTYSHDKCCHTGTTCDNDTDSTPFTCHHGDHSHRVGEKFYPDEHPCFECICMEGYDGTVKEPWCKPVNCGLQESHHAGCAPIFTTGRCCPIGWHCPTDAESLVISSISPPDEGSPKCTFGIHQINLWARMAWENSCIECRCTMPPHVACETKPDCDIAVT